MVLHPSYPSKVKLKRWDMRSRVLERMVNLNSQDEIYKDFKYWEDQSDKFRKDEICFTMEVAQIRPNRNMSRVMIWHPHFPDLFCKDWKRKSRNAHQLYLQSGVMCRFSSSTSFFTC